MRQNKRKKGENQTIARITKIEKTYIVTETKTKKEASLLVAEQILIKPCLQIYMKIYLYNKVQKKRTKAQT